eukprot:gene15337-18180_t
MSVDYDASTIDPQLICFAHAKNVRVTYDVDFDASLADIGNFTWEQEWIAQTIALIQDNYLDGIVFDVEQNMQGMQAALFTAFVVQTSYAFKTINPNYWITLDSTYTPFNGWDFDYTGFADALDMIIMMDYDIFEDINDPLPLITSGIQAYLDLGIPKSKLMSTLPWYGFDNICTEGSTLENITCTTVEDSNDIILSTIMEIMANPNIPNTGPLWSEQLGMPFLMYVSPADGLVHQAWYDNPQSIATKVAAIKPFGLAGIGIFQFETIVGTDLPENIIQEMWDATATFLSN